MKTINQHVSLIEEWLQAYKPTDDFDVPRGVILSFMNTARSALIREDLANIDSSMYQRVDCLPIKQYESKCAVDGYETSFKGLPYVDLPNLVGGIGMKAISYLGTIDLKNRANYTSIDGLSSLEWSQWSKNDFHFTVVDKKAYFVNLPECETKTLTGFFLLDDPMEATDDWDSPYPCHSDHRLFILTTQLISSAYAIRGEDFNNAKQDVNIPMQQQPRQEE